METPAIGTPTAAPAGRSAAASGPTGATTPRAAGTPLQKVDLAFCSQVLCVTPFEVARHRNFFADEGLDVNLIYMKGGAQAVNSLLAGDVDFVGTPIDLLVQSAAKGKAAVMLASTSRLPFFALVVAPQQAKAVLKVADLKGKRIGVANLGTTDHLLAQYLMHKAGLDADAVEFVALGPNLQTQVSRGQVDAAMVQEPGLTLTAQAGGKVLVNLMKRDEARRELGGEYQFMGLNTRPDVLAKPEKAAIAEKLVRALIRGCAETVQRPGNELVALLPEELTTGDQVAKTFATALDTYKAELYPTDGKIDRAAVAQVIEVQRQTGILAGATVTPEQVIDTRFVR